MYICAFVHKYIYVYIGNTDTFNSSFWRALDFTFASRPTHSYNSYSYSLICLYVYGAS